MQTIYCEFRIRMICNVRVTVFDIAIPLQSNIEFDNNFHIVIHNIT